MTCMPSVRPRDDLEHEQVDQADRDEQHEAHHERRIGGEHEVDPQIDIEQMQVRRRQVNAGDLAREQRDDQRGGDHDREIDRGRDQALPEADHVDRRGFALARGATLEHRKCRLVRHSHLIRCPRRRKANTRHRQDFRWAPGPTVTRGRGANQRHRDDGSGLGAQDARPEAERGEAAASSCSSSSARAHPRGRWRS